jgi:hypothetical protein
MRKDGWRVLLAKDMKKRNSAADGELITAAVQLLIDRLDLYQGPFRPRSGQRLPRLSWRRLWKHSGLTDDDTRLVQSLQTAFLMN